MSKIFTYTKVYAKYYDRKRDDYEEYGCEFDYEVDNKDLLEVVIALIIDDYFEGVATKELTLGLKHLIEEFDLLDELVEGYEDSLKEVFEQEALDSYD